MRTRIALVCTVWGDFTDFFCQYCLATLLCPTNLPSACQDYDFTLLFYTSEDDLARARAHMNFQKLATLIDIRPFLLKDLPPAARSGHWIQWHHAILNSDEFSSFILLIPDCLYANDAFPRIARALNESDIIFYCIPQVSLEPLLPSLESRLQAQQSGVFHPHLDFSEQQIAGLFVKFTNPRYAVALQRPEYFVTHPEYILRASKGQIDIHEIACHALAVSSRAENISYALNPMSDSARVAFLGLLAIGVEYSFKYFEQYYRWSTHGMRLSRYTTLSSWCYTFFERGLQEYNGTKTEIRVDGVDVTALRRTPIADPRVKYTRMAFQYYATMYGIYQGPAGVCPPRVRRALALAMSLPGFRRLAMGERGPLTILLPATEEAGEVLELIYEAGDAHILFKYMLMHVLPGRLMLKPGQAFGLERTVTHPADRPRFRIVDPLLVEISPAEITGCITSQGTHLNDDLIAYAANIHYGSAAELVKRLRVSQ